MALPNTTTPNIGSSGTPTPDQVAANNAMTQSGNYTFADGTTSKPGSTLSALSKTTNSAANVPSSSATGLTTLAGNNAINSTTNPTPAPTDPNVALAAAYTAKGINITADDIKNFGLDQAVTIAEKGAADKQTQIDKQNDLNAQATKTAADLAVNDAELAAATSKLNAQMANLAKMGMVKSGDESQSFNGMSSSQYVTSESNFMLNQLIANANSKAAAIKSGDASAVAAINANYEKIVSEGLSKLSSDLAGENQNTAARKASDEQNANTVASRATSQYNTAATLRNHGTSRGRDWE